MGVVKDDNFIYGEDGKSTGQMRNNVCSLIITLAPMKWLEPEYEKNEIRGRKDKRGQDTSWNSYRYGPITASSWLKKCGGLGGVYITTIFVKSTFL